MTDAPAPPGHNRPPPYALLSDDSGPLLDMDAFDADQAFTEETAKELLARVSKMALDFEPDLTTKKGRAEVASRAARISKLKSAIEGRGKDRVADWMQRKRRVDAIRNVYKDGFDEIRERVRKPLTDLEDAEKERQRKINARIERLEAFDPTAYSIDQLPSLDARIAELADYAITEERFGDRMGDAALALRNAESAARAHRQLIVDAEAERRQQVARRAREDAARRAEEAEAAAERERKAAAEADARAAEQAEKAAERAREEERAKAEAARQAEERDRQNKAAEEARRQADHDHRAKINREALASLSEAVPSLDEETAKAVIRAIALGEVEHVGVRY